MGFSLFIARKYIGASKRSGFVTAITIISIAGVALGVLALVVVLSVMNGFETEVLDRIVGTNAHVIVRHEDGIGDYGEVGKLVLGRSDVVGVAPFVLDKAMVISENGTDAVFVKGIDLEAEEAVTQVRNYIHPEGFTFSGDSTSLSKIVVGKELAYSLQVAIGDTIVLARADISSSAPLGILPEFRRFVVGGFFDSGMYDYDASFAFLSLRDAQDFYHMDSKVSGLSVKVKDKFKAPIIGYAIAGILGSGYSVNDWIHLNRSLFKWMNMEKKVMFIILNLIILVAAFNIASTLIMAVLQRTRDIGILRSMGATARSIMNIFMLQGVLIGLIGTTVGIIGGVVLSNLIDKYHLIKLPGDVYFIETVPVLLKPLDVTLIGAVAMLVCFVATIYPAWRAAKLIPVEAIRYE